LQIAAQRPLCHPMQRIEPSVRALEPTGNRQVVMDDNPRDLGRQERPGPAGYLDIPEPVIGEARLPFLDAAAPAEVAIDLFNMGREDARAGRIDHAIGRYRLGATEDDFRA